MNFDEIFKSLKEGGKTLAVQNAAQKNNALATVCTALNNERKKILDANKIDVKKEREKGTSESLIDRLTLNDSRIDSIISSIQTVIDQTDPIGEEVSGWKTQNGLSIRCVRVPLGTVAIIYESRPNVTVDAFCLAYKSGNAILLRGSSSAYNSNRAIVEIIKSALTTADYGVPNAVELVFPDEKNHSDVQEILSAQGNIDVVLPRGSARLIKTVVENSKVPVIETGSGICHLYVDETANLEMAAKIAENGKISRPGVCNALECIVIHKKIADTFLPLLEKRFLGRVQMRADKEAFEILEKISGKKDYIMLANENDFGYEFLDYIVAIKTVDSIDAAIAYINTHNSKHSECIVTENFMTARKFQSEVDAACVYVNASTRFTDGGEFGFGAELGISTQKLHARGPMGIKTLTTTKYLIDGDGQIR